MNGIENKTIIHFSIGEPVTARITIEEFALTENKKYTVLGYGADCVKIENDLGEEDWYAIEYFKEFIGLYRR